MDHPPHELELKTIFKLYLILDQLKINMHILKMQKILTILTDYIPIRLNIPYYSHLIPPNRYNIVYANNTVVRKTI